MRDRIDHHQARRGEEWTTHEAPVDIAAVLARLDAPDNVILIDCLTLWLTNLMMENADIETAFATLAAAIASTKAKLIPSLTRSALASCRKTAWRANSAITPEGYTSASRPSSMKSISSQPGCR